MQNRLVIETLIILKLSFYVLLKYDNTNHPINSFMNIKLNPLYLLTNPIFLFSILSTYTDNFRNNYCLEIFYNYTIFNIIKPMHFYNLNEWMNELIFQNNEHI